MTQTIPSLVIGGGISGLACAFALRKAGVDAQVLEASTRPGGVIRSERRNDFLLEFGPQSFSGTPEILALCLELGIAGDLVEAPQDAPRFVLINGTLRRVPLNPPAFIASPIFDLATKWSLARDIFGNTAPPQKDESIANFVRRKFSAQLLDRLVGPFISGIYAGDPERLSLRSAFPQLHEAELSTGSIIRGLRAAKSRSANQQRPSLLSFRDGNETLIRALSANLGSALRTNTEVLSVEQDADAAVPTFKVTLRTASGNSVIHANRIVLATPPNVTGRLLSSLQPAFDSLLGAIEFASLAVVSLGYPRSSIGHNLQGFGFLAPRSAGLRILGSVWNSSLFPNRAPKNHVLLTNFIGGATDPAAASLSADELTTIAHGELSPLLSIQQTPIFSNVEIYPRALPQYNLGHSARLDTLEKLRLRSPNLWLTGNYLRGPSAGACIEHAQSVADAIIRSTLQPSRY
ncbi:MAG TPA: protoporphyrinogen oxidase [Candidatus Acidoferrum sp.]